MNEQTIKIALKSYWRSAYTAKKCTVYSSSDYWKGRMDLCAELFFDLFGEEIMKSKVEGETE